MAATSVGTVDQALEGGLPVGAVTEMVGAEGSGRTSLALKFVAEMTAEGRVCAWVDVSDALRPAAAAACGVDLGRMLWVRCGRAGAVRVWARMEQGLRVTDLLLQAGGFAAIVLDLGSVAPECVSRIPLATWFRYRAAAERTRACVVLLTQHACAKSSAELVVRMESGEALAREGTVLQGFARRMEVARQRFAEQKVVAMRKPPQRAGVAMWESRAAWAGLP